VQVNDLVGVRDAAAGQGYSLALKDDGTLWAWGTTAPSTTPVQVTDPNDPSGYLSGIQAISAGLKHSLAVQQ
jgi:alpha-tubulin suppressor-like RCC1 family protein